MNKKLCLPALLALATASFATDYSSWGKHRDVTVSTVGVTTTAVKKFPLLIRFTKAAQFDMFTGSFAALASGADLRITKADGTTDVPFEIDNWTTGASGSGAVWVLLDSVPANSASAYTLRVFWNKAAATTMSAPATVFAPSNGFLAVYHFNQASGTPVTNATGGLAATPGSGAAPTDAAGSIVGVGKTFDGSSQFYQVGTDSTALFLNADTGPYTITAWTNVALCGSRIAVISKYANDNSAGTRQFALQTGPTSTNWRLTDNPPLFTGTTSNNEFVAEVAGACTEGAWTYLAGEYNTSGATPTPDATGAGFASLAVNGSFASSTPSIATQATGTSIGGAAPLFIGKIASNERYMNGVIDELTVSNVARSADWVSLSYATQQPTVTNVTVASVSTPPTGITMPQGTLAAGFQIRSSGSSVSFQLPSGLAGARITVLDMSGREVWSQNAAANVREVSWNGASASGSKATAGIYLARLSVLGAGNRFVPAGETKVTLTP